MFYANPTACEMFYADPTACGESRSECSILIPRLAENQDLNVLSCANPTACEMFYADPTACGESMWMFYAYPTACVESRSECSMLFPQLVETQDLNVLC